MDDESVGVAAIAAAIGDPARSRMLFCLMDGCARTSTELSVVADVGPSTASAHLKRLTTANLVSVLSRGKHRYHRLSGPDVAAALESLLVLAGGERVGFIPTTPTRLRAARTCYDHVAGRIGVFLHDAVLARGWLGDAAGDGNYRLTPAGTDGFTRLGVDVPSAQARRRRLAHACIDWSERRPHLAGALGAAVLEVGLRRKWLEQELDSRALRVTSLGRRELTRHLGVGIEPAAL
ncbi:MAG: helix-turn-helix domain-containing protein [Caulobacteraceae bacterium]